MQQLLLTNPYTPAPQIKIMINLGCLFDIATGDYVEGRHGEWILNAGLAPFTGVVGIGNSFKSTIMHYQVLTALARMANTIGNSYDNEMNMHEKRLAALANTIFDYNCLPYECIFESGRWLITDKTVYSGNKWHARFKEFTEDKIKNAAKLQVLTPFWNRGRKGPLTIIQPTFSEMDSFSEFDTDDVIEMQDKNELGDSKANTIYMRQGLAKNRFLMEAVRLNPASYNYMVATAHIGKESTMQNAGPGGSVPIQKLKHLTNGDKIKGATDKFTFVTHNCWHCYKTTTLMSDSKDGPLYPRNANDDLKYDTDLNEVHVRNLRGKSGASGLGLQIIVSQSDGVLPGLTEYHHLKENGKYGLEGGNIHALAIYPEVKVQRTTVRSKIDEDPMLRRALNITSEMCQMSYLWHGMEEGLLCSPKELYDDLKSQGWDWNILLNSRGWWTMDNDQHPIPFISTMDLLKMRQKLYFPYWLEADKITPKKGFHGQ